MLKNKQQNCFTKKHPEEPVCSATFHNKKVKKTDISLSISTGKCTMQKVYTTKRTHVMNSLYSEPGNVSCAIDCFLEVSRYLFQPAFLNLSVRTEFIDLLCNALPEYSNISEKNSNTLPQIREPVWYYLRQHCNSFLPRDKNACFSQIFEERTFGKLNPDEMNVFMTQRKFESNCHTCQKTVTSNLKLFLIYCMYLILL